MPGIHVRSSSRYDYVEREKDPILTVPGSYWLCHKKNIYKFTFKYHRSSRDSKDFNYGKELMKVIRRIIKSQPRQGQQFGTQHLLVTYNHSSWTRQDKMFAMLKFRDRTDASAFPRAFILTVKLLATNPISNGDDEYEDELIIYKKDTSDSQWNDSDGRNPNVNEDGPPKREPNIRTINNDETSSDSSTRLTPISPPETRVNGSVPAINLNKCSNGTKRSNSASLFADLDDLPLLERYLLEQRDQPKASRPSHEPSLSPPKEPLNEMQETVDMPYQYLIEREIERTKKHITKESNPSKQMIVNESICKLSGNSNGETSSRNHTNSTSTIDNATARSADITDLVMEGLMFTIRQDKDTITVMEQKTKLVPDEVLENSEKAETKEGGECLVNSSLLKLENLITKIERSSVVKSKSRCPEDYKSALPINRSYSMNGVFRVDDRTFLNKSRDSMGKGHTIVDPGLSEYHKSKHHSFIAPENLREPMKNRNEELSDSYPSQDKLNMNNGRCVHNNMVNNSSINVSTNSSYSDNCNDKNVSPMSGGVRVIDEPVVKHSSKDLVDDHSTEQYIDVESLKCNNERASIDIDMAKATLRDVKTVNDYMNEFPPTNGCHETNGVIDNLNIDRLPKILGLNESGGTLKLPRIISSEIVKYDLSSLRSSRLRKRLDSDEYVNNSPKHEYIDNEGICTSNVSTQKRPKHAYEEKMEDATVTDRRRLIAKRRLGQKNDDDLTDTTIEMWKFVQDMTRGVRVVLQRLDLSRIQRDIGKKC